MKVLRTYEIYMSPFIIHDNAEDESHISPGKILTVQATEVTQECGIADDYLVLKDLVGVVFRAPFAAVRYCIHKPSAATLKKIKDSHKPADKDTKK